MKTRCLAVATVLLLIAATASAQVPFRHSKVKFETSAYAALEKALGASDGNVFVFFHKEGHRGQRAADSLVLSDVRVSALLNEKYARFAVELEGDYAPRLLSWLRFRGVPEQPFIVMVNLKLQTAQVMISDWGANPDRRGTPLDPEWMLSKLSNFADHGSIE